MAFYYPEKGGGIKNNETHHIISPRAVHPSIRPTCT